jgi:hypothetical protein
VKPAVASRVGRIVTFALAGSIVAFGAALADSQVALHVRTVLASDSGTEFDQRLDTCRRQLKALFHYPSFRLVKEEERRVPWGSQSSFDIPGGRYLQVVPVSEKENRLRLRVVLIEGASPPPLDTDFSVPNHGNIWVGGPRNPDGIVLISIGAEANQ